MLQVRECALAFCSFVIFSLDSPLSPLRSLGMHHKNIMLLKFLTTFDSFFMAIKILGKKGL
jgi:hypothetical protein